MSFSALRNVGEAVKAKNEKAWTRARYARARALCLHPRDRCTPFGVPVRGTRSGRRAVGLSALGLERQRIVVLTQFVECRLDHGVPAALSVVG